MRYVASPPGFSRFAPYLGAGEHRWRQPRQFRHRNAVGAVGGAVGDLVEQHEIALPFARPDMVQRQTVEPAGTGAVVRSRRRVRLLDRLDRGGASDRTALGDQAGSDRRAHRAAAAGSRSDVGARAGADGQPDIVANERPTPTLTRACSRVRR